MKKIFSLALVLLSLCSFAQTDNNKVVTQKLFTVDERVNLQIAFDNHLKEMNLTEDQYYKYTTIIDDNIFYMINYNKKFDKTKSQVIKNRDQVVAKQNKELKKLLNPEQFQTHLKIYQEVFLTPIDNRMKSM